MNIPNNLKIVAYSVGIKSYDFQFGSHRVWSVMEYDEEKALAEAQEQVDFLNMNFPEKEAKVITLWA
jgi:hypothetical protein